MACIGYVHCVCGGVAVVTKATGVFAPKSTLRRRPRVGVIGARQRQHFATKNRTTAVLGGNVPPSEANSNDNHDDDYEETIEKEPLELFREGIDDVRDDAAGRERVELPLFPLQTVLNPGNTIPLYIWEMRYRLLFNRIHDGEESRFGVVLYDKESDSLARIGCTAELVRFEPLLDGRIMTKNLGRERFRIIRIIDEKPYIRALVEFVNDEPAGPEAARIEREVWKMLQDVLQLSNKLYDKSSDITAEIRDTAPKDDVSSASTTAHPEATPIVDDLKRMQEFSFAVNQILDMPLRDQQVLLQMTDTIKRLKRQNKMLRTARNYLAAQVTIKNAGLKGW